MVIKGGREHGEEAVLCTSTKTFALKYVETTNMQLLIAPPDDGSPTGVEDEDADVENSSPCPLSAPGLQTQVQKASTSTFLISSCLMVAPSIRSCLDARLASRRSLWPQQIRPTLR